MGISNVPGDEVSSVLATVSLSTPTGSSEDLTVRVLEVAGCSVAVVATCSSFTFTPSMPMGPDRSSDL